MKNNVETQCNYMVSVLRFLKVRIFLMCIVVLGTYLYYNTIILKSKTRLSFINLKKILYVGTGNLK